MGKAGTQTVLSRWKRATTLSCLAILTILAALLPTIAESHPKTIWGQHGCDVSCYVKRYPDLIGKSDTEVIANYAKYGKRRNCTCRERRRRTRKRRTRKVTKYDGDDIDQDITEGEKLISLLGTKLTPNSLTPNLKTCSFDACGGLTNQRIAVVTGMLICTFLRRTIVLPELNTLGTQDATKKYAALPGGKIAPFGEFYDVKHLVQALTNTSAFASEAWSLRNEQRLQKTEKAKVWNTFGKLDTLMTPTLVNDDLHVALDCAFGAISLQNEPMMQHLFWKINSALTFGKTISALGTKVVRYLGEKSKGGYSAMHVRIEKDWILHCEKWQGSNCLLENGIDMANVLKLQGVPRTNMLYVASGVSLEEMRQMDQFESLFEDYSVLSKELVLHSDPKYQALRPGLDTAIFAAIDFYVCDHASTFIGNSVSTFSAMLLLMSKHRSVNEVLTASQKTKRETSFHYNGGKIPLQELIPISAHRVKKPLKWLFVITQGSSGEYVRMTKVAVQSALSVSGLVPVCMFVPDGSGKPDPLKVWMENKGVIVISHSPTWRDKIVAMNKNSPSHVRARSHLNEDSNMIVATFLRIDIPVLGIMDDHVLYGDADILFRGEVLLEHFAPYKDYTLVMGTENVGDKTSCGNAGVILFDIQKLRETRKEFLHFLFDQRTTMEFDGCGPNDQGALTDFYGPPRNQVRVQSWATFNWKPYWRYNPDAVIVHFHGPKPGHYEDYYAEKPTPQIFGYLFSNMNLQSGVRIYLGEYETFLAVANAPL